MHLEMEMTERDKKLLYRLGIVVILAVFILGSIRPLITLISNKNEEIATAEERKQILDEKSAFLPQLKSRDEKLQSEIEELKGKYYEPMNSADIGDKLTGYMLGQSLMAKDLVIKMPEAPVNFEPYVNSEAGKAKAEAEKSKENNEPKDAMDIAEEELPGGEGELKIADTDVTNTTEAGIYAADVSMKVEGTDENIKKMLDDIDTRLPMVRLVSCAWSDPGRDSYINDEGEMVLRDKDTKVLQLTLQFFMKDIKE
ncbi:MAG: hypothetical protein K6F99_06115 [Lachnospiraceae bacterium]|nr:hypothetical protein [Lachnospiraceae bacterium]